MELEPFFCPTPASAPTPTPTVQHVILMGLILTSIVFRFFKDLKVIDLKSNKLKK